MTADIKIRIVAKKRGFERLGWVGLGWSGRVVLC